MVSVDEAKHIIIAQAPVLPVTVRKVDYAAGYVLAVDVHAPISLPSFRQSSMDGYALNHTDITVEGTSMPLGGESRAGEKELKVLRPGTAMRIFTGAPVPEGATAVVMQEHTRKVGAEIIIDEYPVIDQKNIRRIGQQIREGDIALPAGAILTPGSVGFLTGLNIMEIAVYGKPSVGILVTGDELVRPGEALQHGQVYESNSGMLVAALRQEGITNVEIFYVSDDFNATKRALQDIVSQKDVILASGGISVGDYDFVGNALESLGARTLFYKVKQKPGKPLLAALIDNKMIFALPGNPASSLVCYYEYVLPALRRMSGHTSTCFMRKIQLPSRHSYRFDGARDEFLKAIASEDAVDLLDGQESFALRSFALANALVYLPSSQNVVKVGDLVEVHLLPLMS